MTRWVDTRWHLKFVPLIEHMIPVVSRKTKAVLLGDADAAEVVVEVRELVLSCQRSLHELGDQEDPMCDSLRGRSVKALTAITEHIDRLEAAWIDYLCEVKDKVRRIERKVRADVQEKRAIHRKYRGKNPEVVDLELRSAMDEAKTALQRSLDEVRELKEPSVVRSDEEARLCEQLKEEFSEQYGRVSTSLIINTRRHLERELARASWQVAVRFSKSILSQLE